MGRPLHSVRSVGWARHRAALGRSGAHPGMGWIRVPFLNPLEVQHENQQLSLLNSSWRISSGDRKRVSMRRTSWKCAQVLRRRSRGGKHPIPMASRRTPRPGSTGSIGADQEPLALWSDGTGDPKKSGDWRGHNRVSAALPMGPQADRRISAPSKVGKIVTLCGPQRLGTPSVRTIERGRFEWGASQTRGSG